MLTLRKLPGPVLNFHTASTGKLGRVCEQCSITIAQLGSNVHVVLVVCVRWIIPSNILTTGKGRKRHMHATKPPVEKVLHQAKYRVYAELVQDLISWPSTGSLTYWTLLHTEFLELVGRTCASMYRIYNEVEVFTRYTQPRAAGLRLCIQ